MGLVSWPGAREPGAATGNQSSSPPNSVALGIHSESSQASGESRHRVASGFSLSAGRPAAKAMKPLDGDLRDFDAPDAGLLQRPPCARARAGSGAWPPKEKEAKRNGGRSIPGPKMSLSRLWGKEIWFSPMVVPCKRPFHQPPKDKTPS